MKKVFKMGCLGIIGLIVLGIIIGIASGGGDDTASTSTKENASSKPTETSKPEDTTKTEEKSSIYFISSTI